MYLQFHNTERIEGHRPLDLQVRTPAAEEPNPDPEEIKEIGGDTDSEAEKAKKEKEKKEKEKEKVPKERKKAKKSTEEIVQGEEEAASSAPRKRSKPRRTLF